LREKQEDSDEEVKAKPFSREKSDSNSPLGKI